MAPHLHNSAKGFILTPDVQTSDELGEESAYGY